MGDNLPGQGSVDRYPLLSLAYFMMTSLLVVTALLCTSHLQSIKSVEVLAGMMGVSSKTKTEHPNANFEFEGKFSERELPQYVQGVRVLGEFGFEFRSQVLWAYSANHQSTLVLTAS
jgi:hypothetical protein